MDEPVKKRVDESWKEQAEREKRVADAATPQGSPAPKGSTAGAREGSDELPEARLDLFIQGLAMEALIGLGDIPHPTTRKQAINLPHAKYLIDLLGVLEEKTKGNLSVDEERLFKDLLYQLRTRYLTKSGGVAPA
ncbi:MAG: DUF1844 domain-containing protein [Candidatus Omnitrophota bacterium]|nr:DUF1844 domain-containing protein [Candidatus Omnitrophota bacterium]